MAVRVLNWWNHALHERNDWIQQAKFPATGCSPWWVMPDTDLILPSQVCQHHFLTVTGQLPIPIPSVRPTLWQPPNNLMKLCSIRCKSVNFNDICTHIHACGQGFCHFILHAVSSDPKWLIPPKYNVCPHCSVVLTPSVWSCMSWICHGIESLWIR